MLLSYLPYRLEFRHAFGLSSHTRRETDTVFVKISQDNFDAYGEACLPAYIGETVASTIGFLEHAAAMLQPETMGDAPLPLIQKIHAMGPGNYAAKAAIDMALHDLWGKIRGKPLHELLGLDKSPRHTSFTIAIDGEEKLVQKLHEADDYEFLKIKAGTRNDKQLIRSIRKLTRKPLYVDVNQGWKDKHYVLDMILWMRDQNVRLLEQPMPARMKEEMQWVTQKSGIPVIADESVRTLEDAEQLDGSFSGVNIKLMKCGGIAEAMKLITFLKKRDLFVMLGCMAESSCATAAMAQLMALGDFVDLDAPNLYRNDPFEGLRYRHGRIHMPEEPGTGARPRAGLFK